MTKEEITELFVKGIDCSQVVAGEFGKETGYDKDTLRKMSACFGGGMMCGETCGAVTGALLVLGLKYGHCREDGTNQKAIMQAKVVEFKERYAKKYPSTMCGELLKHDISKPGEMEKVLEEGTMFSYCPCIVEDVIEILNEMIISPKKQTLIMLSAF